MFKTSNFARPILDVDQCDHVNDPSANGLDTWFIVCAMMSCLYVKYGLDQNWHSINRRNEEPVDRRKYFYITWYISKWQKVKSSAKFPKGVLQIQVPWHKSTFIARLGAQLAVMQRLLLLVT